MNVEQAHELLITVVIDRRDDGAYLMQSPNLPLFHAVAESREEILPTAIPIIKGLLERMTGGEVVIREIRELGAPEPTEAATDITPAHVIAQMTGGGRGADGP